MRSADRPRVSVVMPCRNEVKHIRLAIESLLQGTFSSFELLIVDGCSTDGTREIVADLARRDERVRRIDNPRAVTPVALNLGIRAATGDIIVRADAHSAYPNNFIAALVSALASSGAEMVGACSRYVASDGTIPSEAIALALESPFGTGSRFRYRRRSGPVDAVQLGCWHRDLFDRVGYFDERLLRNQDNEHSSRILAHGGHLHMTAATCIDYFPRSSLPALSRYAASSGQWNAFTQHLYPYTFRWRHFLPMLLFFAALLSSVLIMTGRHHPALVWFGILLLSPYLLANLIFAAGATRRRLWLLPAVAVVFALYHLSYGFGIALGWLRVLTGGWRSRIGGGLKEARL